MSKSEKTGGVHTRAVQGRTIERKDRLVEAAIELLADYPLNEISLLDIAKKADMPAGSSYHHFKNATAVFKEISNRFSYDIENVLIAPYSKNESGSWQAIIETLVARAKVLYNECPHYRQIIIGPHAPPEIKLSDREHDIELGNIILGIISRHFIVPEFPRREEIFFYSVEIADLIFMLSQNYHNQITDEMCVEAQRAMVGYLSMYLPRYLPPKVGNTLSDEGNS